MSDKTDAELVLNINKITFRLADECDTLEMRERFCLHDAAVIEAEHLASRLTAANDTIERLTRERDALVAEHDAVAGEITAVYECGPVMLGHELAAWERMKAAHDAAQKAMEEAK
jgi:hypothetical protein